MQIISSQETKVKGAIAWVSEQIQLKKLTQREVAFGSGVHQSQVSRILAGVNVRASKNVLKLCKYADERRARYEPTSSDTQKSHLELQQALSRLWNGSRMHADSIIELLNAVEKVQRTMNKSK